MACDETITLELGAGAFFGPSSSALPEFVIGADAFRQWRSSRLPKWFLVSAPMSWLRRLVAGCFARTASCGAASQAARRLIGSVRIVVAVSPVQRFADVAYGFLPLARAGSVPAVQA